MTRDGSTSAEATSAGQFVGRGGRGRPLSQTGRDTARKKRATFVFFEVTNGQDLNQRAKWLKSHIYNIYITNLDLTKITGSPLLR